MTKIAYSACYGGASLSDKAIQRIAELKGIKIFKGNDHPLLHELISYYYTVPVEEYEHLLGEDSDKSNDYIFDVFSLYENRTDPHLIQVIEELGEEANGFASNWKIVDLAPGTKYHIHEYDGYESVMTPDDYNWSVA